MADKTIRSKAIAVAAELAAMKYRFPFDRIILLRDDPIGKSAGGIILPDTAKRKPVKGTIVALGENLHGDSEFQSDAALNLGQIAVLDRILFTKYNPMLVELLDSKGTIMELDVMHPMDIYVVM